MLPPNNRIEGTGCKRRCAGMQPAPHAERSTVRLRESAEFPTEVKEVLAMFVASVLLCTFTPCLTPWNASFRVCRC